MQRVFAPGEVRNQLKDESLEIMNFALAAYNNANVHAMRLWYAASLVSVPVLTTAAGLKAVPIQGLSLDFSDTLPTLLLILSALNIVFVVAQIGHYRMAQIYSLIVNETFSEGALVSKSVTWRSFLFNSRISANNRVMPIFESFGIDGGSWVAKTLKFIVDLAFGLFPAIALVVGLFVLPSSSPLYVLINIVGFISVVSSLAILGHAVKWVTIFVSK